MAQTFESPVDSVTILGRTLNNVLVEGRSHAPTRTVTFSIMETKKDMIFHALFDRPDQLEAVQVDDKWKVKVPLVQSKCDLGAKEVVDLVFPSERAAKDFIRQARGL